MFAASNRCIPTCRIAFIRGALVRGALLLSLFFAPSAYAITSINILADNTMGVAMTQIARNYSREKQVVVNASFATEKAQETQISEGGAADILITPKLAWIEQLKTQGLVDIYSQVSIASNRLALAGPVDSPIVLKKTDPFPVAALITAMAGEQAFLVGNPETLTVGTYGKEALRTLAVNDDLEPYTLYIKESRQMDEMVQKQHAYGIFYSSSVYRKEGMRTIQLLPKESHHPISYYAVVIAGENMNEARKFLDYLKSPPTRKLLRDNGFAVD